MPWRHELVVAAAADYFFDTRTNAALAAWAYGAVPMERRRVSRRSADRAAALLDDGWSMLIFPEGGRSPDGWGQEHKGGAAYLSVRCGVPVVPVHLDGTGRILPRGARVPTPGRVVINIGAPVRAGAEEDARHLAVRIEQAIATLADETDERLVGSRAAARTAATSRRSGGRSPTPGGVTGPHRIASRAATTGVTGRAERATVWPGTDGHRCGPDAGGSAAAVGELGAAEHREPPGVACVEPRVVRSELGAQGLLALPEHDVGPGTLERRLPAVLELEQVPVVDERLGGGSVVDVGVRAVAVAPLEVVADVVVAARRWCRWRPGPAARASRSPRPGTRSRRYPGVLSGEHDDDCREEPRAEPW